MKSTKNFRMNEWRKKKKRNQKKKDKSRKKIRNKETQIEVRFTIFNVVRSFSYFSVSHQRTTVIVNQLDLPINHKSHRPRFETTHSDYDRSREHERTLHNAPRELCNCVKPTYRVSAFSLSIDSSSIVHVNNNRLVMAYKIGAILASVINEPIIIIDIISNDRLLFSFLSSSKIFFLFFFFTQILCSFYQNRF